MCRQSLAFVAYLLVVALATLAEASAPIVDENLVFAEQDGFVAVEAEHFFRQSHSDKRAFHLTTTDMTPDVGADGDSAHVAGASGGAYLEILPDTRKSSKDKLVKGENFSDEPGKLAVVSYHVVFTTPGRYYVWVRAYSSGSEDNGLHVGLDGAWPASGQRLQWCRGKNSWYWESKQRTKEVHCGEPHKIYLDIKDPGPHVVSFSMREDGFEFDKWLMTTNREFARPDGVGPQSQAVGGKLPKTFPVVAGGKEFPAHWGEPPQIQTRDLRPLPGGYGNGSSTLARWIQENLDRDVREQPQLATRGADGDGSVTVDGETKQWHKVTVTLDGPFADESDTTPNPFTDLCFETTFTHADGTEYVVPGYFAADGDAANTSADAGTQWRCHFAPDRQGEWTYITKFRKGKLAALDSNAKCETLKPFDGKSGKFSVAASDKSGRDLRGEGRLEYVGKRYLRFAGSGRYFLKMGADSPETLLGYTDFDNTRVGNAKKAPLKTWAPHVQDWKPGDPIWQVDKDSNGKGKGLIGAINYLSSKGCNAFSFLTYNAGGDGDNVWPFAERDDKLHYDCSKLDQWGIVFDHGTAKGMYLHFKMQETENDDDNRGQKAGGKGTVPESLDGGDLGVQRKLYCRELVARFGHNLALNWNLGEENTQSTAQRQAMADYIAQCDPYDHLIVVHTFPGQQDKVYRPLMGGKSKLRGASLQNSDISDTHSHVVKWVEASAATGTPWVIAFDESGSAAHGQCPDIGYEGFDGHDSAGQMTYTPDTIRHQTLWATLLGGGAGCEYYFGYNYAENDLNCEDWRSRDKSWDDGRIAVNFFADNKIPYWQMTPSDALVDNAKHNNSRYCLAKPNECYVVYLPIGVETKLDLSAATGPFTVAWFDPRGGGALQTGSVTSIEAGDAVSLGSSPSDSEKDWVVVVRR